MVEQKRESFRVEFPRSYYPTITLQDKSFDVFDASEFGIKFYNASDSHFIQDKVINTTIIFPDNEQFNVKAKIVRIEKKFISIELLEALPLSKIREQHLLLIQKFSEKKSAL
ncbi:MAG: PilZ domain-containing protein [Gammaproteobacteria bacterium]|nr:PilZ domain-containing protein [Gammaproteobacteria bacterium]